MHAQHIIHHLLTHACDWMHAARRKALTVSVLAALTGRRLTVTALGRSIGSVAKEKHCIKRADRLLSNRHLQADRLRRYTALGHWCIESTPRPVFLVDWSDLDASKTHFLLRVSLPLRGRALTVYEEVHTAKTKEKLSPDHYYRCGLSYPVVSPATSCGKCLAGHHPGSYA
jgi:hypothetical protein